MDIIIIIFFIDQTARRHTIANAIHLVTFSKGKVLCKFVVTMATLISLTSGNYSQ